MKYKVRRRIDGDGIQVQESIEEIEFDGTRDELLQHSHILEILEEIDDKKEVQKDITQEDVVFQNKPLIVKKSK